MTTLSEMIISLVIRQKGKSQNGGNKKAKHAKFSDKGTFLTPWYTHDVFMVAIHHFTISVTPNRSKKGLVQLKHLSTKIKEVTSNAAITEKNEKQYIRLQRGLPWNPRAIFHWYRWLFNVMFKLLKIFCRWFQINNTNGKYIKMIPNKFWCETYIMYSFWNQFCVHSFCFLKNWSI